MDHSFQPDVIPCLAKYKIIFAVSYVRGGGELGEGWHRAGKGFKKVSQLFIAGKLRF